MEHEFLKRLPNHAPSIGLSQTSVINYNWFGIVFNYMASESKVVSDYGGRYVYKSPRFFLCVPKVDQSAVNSLLNDLGLL